MPLRRKGPFQFPKELKHFDNFDLDLELPVHVAMARTALLDTQSRS